MTADWWDCMPCDGRGWGSLWLSTEQREAIRAKLCSVHRRHLEQERKNWDEIGVAIKQMKPEDLKFALKNKKHRARSSEADRREGDE